MPAFSGRLLLKAGAEGVHCGAIPELGLGIALKCDDGATRASEVMMAAAIDTLMPMADAEHAHLADWLMAAVETRKGRKVGEVRPAAGLVDSIREGRSLS
jgi:L-asparaginase II